MITIRARNVNDGYQQAVSLLRTDGVREDSRNGEVLRAPCPVAVVFQRPTERVLFHRPTANPFFHMAEALWMLAGRDDLGYLTRYVKRMGQFSDDGGKTQPGAYGFRWRHHFDRDQLEWAVGRLSRDKGDRRVVIQMYDPSFDQPAADRGGRDIPCNTSIMLRVRNGALDMTVTNRSNDVVWGLFGANAVHFSVLHEWLAAQLHIPVGLWYQLSNDFHGYTETLPEAVSREPCPYSVGMVSPLPVDYGHDNRTWLEDLGMFLEEPARVGIRVAWLRRVACPVLMAHQAYREKRVDHAMEVIAQCQASDWRLACMRWLEARK